VLGRIVVTIPHIIFSKSSASISIIKQRSQHVKIMLHTDILLRRAWPNRVRAAHAKPAHQMENSAPRCTEFLHRLTIIRWEGYPLAAIIDRALRMRDAFDSYARLSRRSEPCPPDIYHIFHVSKELNAEDINDDSIVESAKNLCFDTRS
jgi:hypothetical protein